MVQNCATDKRPKVLVAEDHPTTRKLMSAWLEMSGYSVQQAEDGESAWNSAKLACPPIVVTDWNMPRMSGLELCRYIRAHHGSDQVYVLIATSREPGDNLTEAMDAGANDFLSKPIREDEFLARIRSAENALRRLQSKTELADSDELTGLLNRRSFYERGQRTLDMAHQEGLAVACAVLDIDLFKQFNDRYGHAVGDEVLRTVASAFLEECRDSDLVCRLGGDEFCMLLPGASEAAAVEVAERVRTRIGTHAVQVNGEQVRIRTTFGIAPLADGVETITELIELADKVLLAAKDDGRDRTLSLFGLCLRNSQSGPPGGESYIELLRSRRAEDIMTEVSTVFSAEESLNAACRALLQANVDCACVIGEQGELQGIVTERDLLNALSTGVATECPLREITSSNIARFGPHVGVADIWECLQRTPMLRSVIVDSRGAPIGFVRRRALLRLLHEFVGAGKGPLPGKRDS